MWHNDTEGKAARVRAGETRAFVNPDEWRPYNLWCITNLENMEREEAEE
jgi:hypothetical protein